MRNEKVVRDTKPSPQSTFVPKKIILNKNRDLNHHIPNALVLNEKPRDQKVQPKPLVFKYNNQKSQNQISSVNMSPCVIEQRKSPVSEFSS